MRTVHIDINKWICGSTGLLAVLALSAAGCGKTSTTSSGVTVSGTIAAASGSSLVEMRDMAEEFESVDRSSITSYSVDCVTLGSSTSSSCSGTCDSSGNFSCGPLPTGTPFGCFVEQGTTIVAVMAFTSSTTGLNGSSTSQGTIVAGSGTTGLSLGQISVNTTTGTAVVNMANVQATGGSTPTGTSSGLSSFANLERPNGWTLTALPSDQVPPGVQAPCAAGTQNCNGPSVGQQVFLAQYEATDSSGGTHVGLSIWNGAGATAMTDYNNCTSGGHGEGVTLPSGFTAIAGPNNNAALLTGALAMSTSIPDPSTVTPQNSQYATCGVTSWASGAHCSDIASQTGFSDPDTATSSATGSAGTAGKDSCAFLCVLNNIGHAAQSGSCGAQAYVDWNKMQSSVWTGHTHFDPVYSGGTWADHEASITGGGSNVSFAQDAAGTVQGSAASFLGGAVVFGGGNPSNRFMIGELIIAGGNDTGIGSLSNQQPTQSFTVCQPGQMTGSGCPSQYQVTCNITEVDQLTITETSTDATGAASAVVQLTQNRTLTSTGTNASYTACQSAIQGGGNMVGQSMFIFGLKGN